MGNLDGSTVLLLVALAIVAVILWAADNAHRLAHARFTWSTLTRFAPGLGQFHLTVRHAPSCPVPCALAVHQGDLSPLSQQLGSHDECVYCRTFVPHTLELCRVTFAAHGRPDPVLIPRWASHAQAVRALLVPPPVRA